CDGSSAPPARPTVRVSFLAIVGLAAAPAPAQDPELDALEVRLIELEAGAEEARRRAEAERVRAEAAAVEAARRAAQSPAFDLVGELIHIAAGKFRMGDVAGDDGSWDDAEWQVRSATRSESDAWGRSSDRGFRVALDAAH